MNSVELSGRLTRDPEIRYTNDQMCVAAFTLAVDRHDKNKNTDFPSVKAFGRLGEIVEKYCKKGKLIEVRGTLETGSYEGKNGKVYTTDVVADKINLVSEPQEQKHSYSAAANKIEQAPEPQQVDAFAEVDEDVPF